MIPKQLFHYTKASTGLEKILFQGKLAINQLECMNDPKESKAFRFTSFQLPASTAMDFSSAESAELQKRLESIGKSIKLREWKVLCLSKNHPNVEPGIDIPLYWGSCRPGMWAHYAENHRGMCLEFDGNRLDQEIRKTVSETSAESEVRCGDVAYDDNKIIDQWTPQLDLDNIAQAADAEIQASLREYFKRNYQDVFLTKAKDWESEYEFRWLVHTEKDSQIFVPIKDALVGVFVGVDFPKAYYPSLLDVCRRLDVPARRLEWDNGRPFHAPISNP